MVYKDFRYIYPPRPKNAISPDELISWDNMTLICQPKLNGSNTTIYINGERSFVMNRHGSTLSNFKMNDLEINHLFKGRVGDWFVLNGEYLNKSKLDEDGNLFNNKFVIFDILVYNSDYLIGKTFSERVDILDSLYGKENSDKDYLYSVSENIYRVKTWETEFKSHFDRLSQIDVCEGLVLKRKRAKLEMGTTELNNTKSQIKARKRTKNYAF